MVAHRVHQRDLELPCCVVGDHLIVHAQLNLEAAVHFGLSLLIRPVLSTLLLQTDGWTHTHTQGDDEMTHKHCLAPSHNFLVLLLTT